jgi:hypothetical protein
MWTFLRLRQAFSFAVADEIVGKSTQQRSPANRRQIPDYQQSVVYRDPK